MIMLAIDHYPGQMSEVARRLGIGRSTLYRKLKEHGIDPETAGPTGLRHVSCRTMPAPQIFRCAFPLNLCVKPDVNLVAAGSFRPNFAMVSPHFGFNKL